MWIMANKSNNPDPKASSSSLPCCTAWRRQWRRWGPSPRRWPAYSSQLVGCVFSGEELSSSPPHLRQPHLKKRVGEVRAVQVKGINRRCWVVDTSETGHHVLVLGWEMQHIVKKGCVIAADAQNKTSKHVCRHKWWWGPSGELWQGWNWAVTTHPWAKYNCKCKWSFSSVRSGEDLHLK